MLPSRGLPLGPKGRLYSGCVCRVMLYGSKTWPVKEEDMFRLEVNNARMFRWMCCDKMSSEELSTRVKLKSMREYSGHLQRMEESAWSSKCITFKWYFPHGTFKKTWNEEIRNDLKERKASKDIPKDTNACRSFIRNHPTCESMRNRGQDEYNDDMMMISFLLLTFLYGLECLGHLNVLDLCYKQAN